MHRGRWHYDYHVFYRMFLILDIEINTAAPTETIRDASYVATATTNSHHITPHHITPHHTTPYHIISYHTTPHHTTPHHTTPYHITSHHTTPHHITSHHTTPYHITPHHIASYHTTPHHTTPHHTTPYHTTPHHTTSHHITPYHTTLHHTTPHHTPTQSPYPHTSSTPLPLSGITIPTGPAFKFNAASRPWPSIPRTSPDRRWVVLSLRTYTVCTPTSWLVIQDGMQREEEHIGKHVSCIWIHTYVLKYIHTYLPK